MSPRLLSQALDSFINTAIAVCIVSAGKPAYKHWLKGVNSCSECPLKLESGTDDSALAERKACCAEIIFIKNENN